MHKYLNKIYSSKFGKAFLFLVPILIFIALALFVHPATVSAQVNPETSFNPPPSLSKIYEVLSTNNGGVGHEVRVLWTRMMNLVNSLVVIVLIVVAFAEILRININTYGIKKILPTLVLAVIAANFSYIICRFIVDIANVMLTLFLNDTDTKCITNGIRISSFFKDNIETIISTLNENKAKTGGTGGIMTALALVIFSIVAAVITLILAFLFTIRNYVIYLMVIVSPIAFMAMILPQTKSYFNQWFSWMFKWTFMPTVSIALIWMGGQLLKISGIGSSPLMGMVLSVAFLVLAIQVPFKLGGPIMQKWGDLGKKAWGATGGAVTNKIGSNVKDYWSTKAKDVAGRAWGNWKMLGLNMVRSSDSKGFKSLLGNSFIFGSGTDRAKADLELTERFSKGLTEGFQARHLYTGKRGRNNAMREGYIDNRTGEKKEYRSYAEEDIFKSTNLDANDPENKKRITQYEQLKKWRLGSGHARRRMAIAEMHMSDLIAQGTFASIEGRLMAKGDQSDEAIEERVIKAKLDTMLTSAEKDAIKTGVITANPGVSGAKLERMTAEAVKDAALAKITPAEALSLRGDIDKEIKKSKDANKDRQEEDFSRVMGMSPPDVAEWKDFQRFVVTEKESTERLKGKAEKDILIKPTMDQLAVHEQAELSQETAITVQKFKELSGELQKFIKEVKKDGRTLSDMTLEEKEKLSTFSDTDKSAFNSYLNNQGRATVRLREMGMLNETEDFAGSDSDADKKIVQAVDERYDDFIKNFVKKKIEKGIPAYLRNVIHQDTAGNISISRMERTTYTRGLGVAAEKTRGRVTDYSSMTVDTLANLLTSGDKKDGITARDVADFLTGKATLDSNKRSRMMAMVEAMTTKLNNSNDATSAASFFVSRLSTSKDHNEVFELYKQFKAARDEQGASWTTGTAVKDALKDADAVFADGAGNPIELQKQLMRVYAAVPQNSKGAVNGIVRKFIHNASY